MRRRRKQRKADDSRSADKKRQTGFKRELEPQEVIHRFFQPNKFEIVRLVVKLSGKMQRPESTTVADFSREGYGSELKKYFRGSVKRAIRETFHDLNNSKKKKKEKN